MRRAAIYASHYIRYRALRPHTPLTTHARAYWHYAYAAVMQDLREERQRSTWMWIRQRERLQFAYEAALLRRHDVRSVGVPPPPPMPFPYHAQSHPLPGSLQQRSAGMQPTDIEMIEAQLDLYALRQSRERVRAKLAEVTAELTKTAEEAIAAGMLARTAPHY